MATLLAEKMFTYCNSSKMGTGSFSGAKCGRGVLLTTHPVLVPWSWKSRVIPPPTLWATGPVTGSLYLYLFTTEISDYIHTAISLNYKF